MSPKKLEIWLVYNTILLYKRQNNDMFKPFKNQISFYHNQFCPYLKDAEQEFLSSSNFNKISYTSYF